MSVAPMWAASSPDFRIFIDAATLKADAGFTEDDALKSISASL